MYLNASGQEQAAPQPLKRNYFEPDIAPVHVSGPIKAKHMPAKYALAQMNNDKLYECCRDLDNLTVNYYRTPTEKGGKVDLMITQCTCGRKHYRVALGGGKV